MGGDGFTNQSKTLYENAGYQVDTITGDKVTVDTMKNIPKGYDTIILRVHSGLFEDQVWFFTAEPYDAKKHILEQITGEVHIGRTNYNEQSVFAIGAPFIRKYLNLDNTLIIQMGCNGISSNDLAEAFLESGAVAYISWDGPVTLETTDTATLQLIKHIIEGQTPEEATENIQNLHYSEKIYESQLVCIKKEIDSLYQ